MKTVYVTYKQNNMLKNATLTESKYVELKKDNSITELTMYPSMMLMELNYKALLENNGSSGKKIIYG